MWTGSTTRKQYRRKDGTLSRGPHYGEMSGLKNLGLPVRKNGTMRTHRLSYVLAFGDPGAALGVNHLCHNPLCVRPSHLYAGTQQQNNDNKKEDGTRGSKLNQVKVTQIRRFAKMGISRKSIASAFGITERYVGNVINRVTWKDSHVES